MCLITIDIEARSISKCPFYAIQPSDQELIYIYICIFANGPEDRCSVPGLVIPKTQKMISGLLHFTLDP